MSENLTRAQKAMLKRLPAKVEHGNTVAVELLQAGLAYRKPMTWLMPTDLGRAALAQLEKS